MGDEAVPEVLKYDVRKDQEIRAQEVKHCLLCRNEGVPFYQKLRDRLFGVPGTWSFMHCSECDIIWLSPQPIQDDIYKLYIEYFTHGRAIPHNQGVDQKRSPWETFKDIILPGRHRERELYHWMFLGKEKPGRLLDVGCGDGQFLSMMRKFGWDVIGVEPDPQAASVAKKLGLQIIVGKLEEINLPYNSFDVITLSHVIEHVNDPLTLIWRCFNLLRVGGKLVITTPNIRSLGHQLFKDAWLGLDPPRHLHLYSPKLLKRIVDSLGFNVVRLTTSARLASAVYEAGISIRSTGRVRISYSGGVNKFKQIVNRSMFVVLEFWLNKAIGSIGEEIGVLAIKRGSVLSKLDQNRKPSY